MTDINKKKHKITCPDCKEASDGQLKYRAETKNHFALYYCPLCKNEWDPSEVLVEKYKIARFMGRDGEWKFIRHTESNMKRMRTETNMWNPRSMNRKRDARGKFAGGMNKQDVNMLKRLRKK